MLKLLKEMIIEVRIGKAKKLNIQEVFMLNGHLRENQDIEITRKSRLQAFTFAVHRQPIENGMKEKARSTTDCDFWKELLFIH
jgi:hypothetical protein